MMNKTSEWGLARSSWGLKAILRVMLLIFVFALLLLYFLSMPLALELFLFGDLSATYAPSYPLTVRFLHFHIEVALSYVFVLLVLLYFLCFVLAWKKKIGLREAVEGFLSKSVSSYMRNSLFALPILSSTIYITLRSIHYIQESYGIPVGTPPLSEDPLLMFYGLFISPLSEELIYRILPLGVFLAVRLLTAYRDRLSIMFWKERLGVFLTALMSPEAAKRKFGMKTVGDSGFLKGLGSDEWVMILFTTVFFAVSHYFTGTWDVGKIASSFVQGLFMALSYLVYGIQAPILIHWFFNCHLYTFGLAAVVYPNLAFLNLLNEKLTFGLGILGSVTFAYWAAREIAENKILGLKMLHSSAKKAKARLAAKSDELLVALRQLDLFDMTAVVLTVVIFCVRLIIVNFPSPQVGEKYYETGFIFDEHYYVAAARKMLTGEPANNEHPPLSKALFMLGIALFGDNPLGWRISPIIMSSMSVALVYWTALLLGGRKNAAFSAAFIFAVDVMAFNIGQISMLDGPSMLFVLAGTVLLIKERHDMGGLFLGLATLCKLSAIFAAAGILFFTVLARNAVQKKNRFFSVQQINLLGRVFFIALITFIIGLWVYDARYGVFNNNPLDHISYMYSYHDGLKYQNIQDVILPVDWINPFNCFSPAPYYVTTVRGVFNGAVREYHPIAYYGIYTPLWWSIWLVVPICLVQTVRRIRKNTSLEAGFFTLAWIAANYFPFIPLGYLMQRWVYPFYFYMSLPGVYIGLSHYMAQSRHPKIALGLIMAVNLIWFVVWFPVKPKLLIDLLLLLGLPA